MTCTITDAYNLFHKGSLALAQVEANGIKIDTDFLAKATKRTEQQISQLEQELKEDEVWKNWEKVYPNANLTSRTQLADVLFKHMGYICTMFTPGGKPSADEKHLQTIGSPFVEKYLEMAKLEKMRGTYLTGIAREVDSNGFLHPVFNLASGYGRDEEKGGARSYRSSCQLPNFQNMPIRNKVQGKTIRKCFIPRPGNVLLEVDYSALEAKIIACYWKDPALIAYVCDPKKDIHRDVAASVYGLDFAEWDKSAYKDIRYCAKNMFVFPQFYGSDYIKCSRALWDAIDKMKLTTPDGVSLHEHLAKSGITELGRCDRDRRPKQGTFEHHVERFERKFWDEWFPTCKRERDVWVKNYRKNGYFDLHTGFRVEGAYSRNEVFNLPVQGAGFHCLLWSLIRLQKYLNKHQRETKIVGQIHDSMLLDGPRTEIMNLLPVIRKIMTKLIRKVWPWIIVDLDIEADIVDEGMSWADKKPIPI